MVFQPRLSQLKQTALRHIQYMVHIKHLDQFQIPIILYFQPSTKVILVFERQFWQDNGKSFYSGGNVVSGLPIKISYFPSKPAKSGVGVLLASYTWGEDAERQQAMTEDDLVEMPELREQIHAWMAEKSGKAPK